jgi:hypothetical protein
MMIRVNLIPPEGVEEYSIVRREITFNFLIIILFIVVAFFLIMQANAKKGELMLVLEPLKKQYEELKPIEKAWKEYQEKKAIVEERKRLALTLAKQRLVAIKSLENVTASFLVGKMWFEGLTIEENKLIIKGVVLNNIILADFMERLRKTNYFGDLVISVEPKRRQVGELNLTAFTLTCSIIGEG